MIFLTVGTDHHQFTRLLKKVDELIEADVIDDSLVVQYGSNKYIPKQASEAYKFLDFEKMLEYMERADIVITHASSTAMLTVSQGKIPVVVPRNKKYREIVDQHQLEFARSMGDELSMIIAYDMDELEYVLRNFKSLEQSVRKKNSTAGRAMASNAVYELNTVVVKWFGTD